MAGTVAGRVSVMCWWCGVINNYRSYYVQRCHAASSVNELGAGSCNSPTDSCKFPTDEIMGAQKFNFPSNSPKMGDFQSKFFFARTFSHAPTDATTPLHARTSLCLVSSHLSFDEPSRIHRTLCDRAAHLLNSTVFEFTRIAHTISLCIRLMTHFFCSLRDDSFRVYFWTWRYVAGGRKEEKCPRFPSIHALRMEDSRTARRAIQWELTGCKRKPGRPRKNWMDIIRRDLEDMDTTWDEAEQLATDRAEWRQRVAAQCIHLDAGWTKLLWYSFHFL